jgi:DNA-binding beta-propeller fold protein YncE
MKTRLLVFALALTSFAATVHAQFTLKFDGEFPDLRSALAYVAAVRLQYAMIGMETYVHSTVSRDQGWKPAYDANGNIIPGQYQQEPVQVQFFVPDGVAAPPGSTPPHSFGLKPAATQVPRTVYVTDQSFNAVRAMNILDGSILATVQLPGTGGPSGIAITPDGKFLWVCESLLPQGANASEIEIIDTASFQIVGSIPLGPKVVATYIAMTPDGSTAYVTNTGLVIQGDGSGAVNSILILDVASRKLNGQFLPPLLNPQRPTSGSAVFDRLAVSPDGTLLYATSAQGIFVFDTLTNTQVNPPTSALAIVNISGFNVAGITPTPGGPIVLHPNGARAYFTSLLCPSPNASNICLAVMDTKTNLIVDAVPLGQSSTSRATGLGISPDGTWVAIKEFNSGNWIIVDTTLDKVVTRVPGQAQTSTIFFGGN